MTYTVYVDSITGNHFVLKHCSIHSVNARSTPESEQKLVEGGVVATNCNIIDWRWQCSGPNGWGQHTYDDEARAFKVLK